MTWFAVFSLVLAVILGAAAVLGLLGYIGIITVGFVFDKAMSKFFPKGRYDD